MSPKTKAGEKITWKEFGKRWKQGIENVTPFQQVKTTMLGLIISLIGVSWGIVFGLYLKLWWLVVILVGALFVTGVQLLASIQKYMVFKRLEAMVNEMG